MGGHEPSPCPYSPLNGLCTVQWGTNTLTSTLDDVVEHVAASRSQHQNVRVLIKVKDVAVNTGILPGHVVDDLCTQQGKHHTVLQPGNELVKPGKHGAGWGGSGTRGSEAGFRHEEHGTARCTWAARLGEACRRSV